MRTMINMFLTLTILGFSLTEPVISTNSLLMLGILLIANILCQIRDKEQVTEKAPRYESYNSYMTREIHRGRPAPTYKEYHEYVEKIFRESEKEGTQPTHESNGSDQEQ